MTRLRQRLAALVATVSGRTRSPGASRALRRAGRPRLWVAGMVAVLLTGIIGGGLLLSGRGERPAATASPGPTAPSTSSSSTSTTLPFDRLTASVSPSRVRAGGSVMVVGRGCDPRYSATVSIDVHPPDPVIVEPSLRQDGRFSARVPVPATAQPGRYEILVFCYATSSRPHEVRRPITVTS